MTRLTLGLKVLPVSARRGIGTRSIHRNRSALSSRYEESLFYTFGLSFSTKTISLLGHEIIRRQAYNVVFIDPRNLGRFWDSTNSSEKLYNSWDTGCIWALLLVHTTHRLLDKRLTCFELVPLEKGKRDYAFQTVNGYICYTLDTIKYEV